MNFPPPCFADLLPTTQTDTKIIVIAAMRRGISINRGMLLDRDIGGLSHWLLFTFYEYGCGHSVTHWF